MTPDEVRAGITRLKQSKSPATVGLLANLLEDFARQVAEAMASNTRAMTQLEKRVAELERVPLTFTGPHESGRTYQKNELVVHDGSLWICLRNGTTQRPGSGDAWCLCCKRGRDGRDAR